MSDATKAAMDDAIAAHVKDELEAGLLVAYILTVAAIKPEDSDDVTHYLRCSADQPVHVSLGLAEYHVTMLRHELTEDAQ